MDQIAQHRPAGGAGLPVAQIFGEQVDGIAVLLYHIERQVDPPDAEITSNVLPEVGELQRRASGVGEAVSLRVGVAP